MDSLVIQGPCQLQGQSRISGSKNAALPMLFASLLSEKPVLFKHVPRLWDIETTLQLLNSMGAESKWDKEAGTVELFPKILKPVAPYEFVKKMRAGILALGPLLARSGQAQVSLPGGCAIGARPVNFHIDALRKMGVQIEIKEGYIFASAKEGLKGAEIEFPQVTVTGTENLMMAASRAQGKTILKNAAREPEVTALGRMLQAGGISIEGLGTDKLIIEGGNPFYTTEAVWIPSDRIEAGTMIAAAAITRSSVILEDAPYEDMSSVLDVFKKMGIHLGWNEQTRQLSIQVPKELKPVDILTYPYPGFPTDMQAQLMSVLCTIKGQSRIHETIFENRFMHVAELRRMGAQIEIRGSEAIVDGGTPLRAAPVMATDLRASACLVLAALAAEGTTEISRIYHLDRGYQRLDEKLNALGTKISRNKN